MTEDELREKVAQAIYVAAVGSDPIEENWELHSPLNVDNGEEAHKWYLQMADGAMAEIAEYEGEIN